jgi:cell division protein FtsI/penicillin-binding protein 2
LRIVTRQERLVCNSEAVRFLAGKVELRDGVQCGVSGWELQNELLLRGIPGRYSVLLDRFGNYMPKSFKLGAPPSDGRDLHLTETLEELELKMKQEPQI